MPPWPLVLPALALVFGWTDAAPIEFSRMPKNVTLSAGSSLRLECRVVRASNRTEPLETKKVKAVWLWNEGTLPPADRNRTTVRKTLVDGAVSSVLKIRRVDPLDRGYYRCLFTEGKTKISAEAYVAVAADAGAGPPTMSTLPSETDGPTSPLFGETSEREREPEPTAGGPPRGVCQPYEGQICQRHLGGHSVFVPPGATQGSTERLLHSALQVVSYSNEISSDCRNYTLPSICFSVFPICRTPDETNERFFGAAGRADVKREFAYDRVPLRRVCKRDCEILENELCQKEYAIAKRHPQIGQLRLEDCVDLPADAPDCLEVGIAGDVETDDECYWEIGLSYRGPVNETPSGLPCIKWSHQFKLKIGAHKELAGGHNFCRNPDGSEAQPWCFVEAGKIEKRVCDVPRCSQKIWILIIAGIASSGFLLASCLICAFCRHRNSKNNNAAIRNISVPNADKNIYGNSRLNSPIEMGDLINGQSSLGNGSRGNKALRVPQYDLSQIRLVEELGEGAFGKVYKGELTRANETVFVAVKALKENASVKTQTDFRREIELISELHHENIVCILGVALREEPLCMLFEYMAKGDLHEFLVGRAPPNDIGLTQMQFLNISHHIASGMEYLAAHHYVHRDLAARNCLVADNLIVKISDFGLSRDIYSSDYYRVQSKSLLPVRWMPPESILYGKFTTESDVWSYGIVLWEIYSYGLQPYYGYSNQEVISMVRNRELLQCPAECPRAVYSLIRECWHQTAARRPNFTLIVNRLSEMKHSNNIVLHGDNTSESSGAHSGQRPPISLGDPRERVPLISHHSSSNGSLAGSMPRKLSTAGSIRSHASTRLMVSSSDVTSGSDNCDNVRAKKSSVGSLLDGQPSVERHSKLPPKGHPY